MTSSSLLQIMEMVHNKLYNLTLSNHIHLLDKAATVIYLKSMLQASSYFNSKITSSLSYM
jgi:hypothetical protein